MKKSYRRDYISAHFEAIRDEVLTFEAVAKIINCQVVHVKLLYNRELLRRARAESKLAKELRQQPKSFIYMGDSIVLTYESRLNYESSTIKEQNTASS